MINSRYVFREFETPEIANIEMKMEKNAPTQMCIQHTRRGSQKKQKKNQYFHDVIKEEAASEFWDPQKIISCIQISQIEEVDLY